MSAVAETPRDGSGAVPRHRHLWSLPDGTGLHAPYGELVIEASTGRVCCHLCGQWFVSLGSHLRRHGHTADSYRKTMGLCRSRPLVAQALSRSIATRQRAVYQRSPAMRARLAVGQQMSKTGELTGLASASHSGGPPPELIRLRRAALDAGRATRSAQRERALDYRVRELGFPDLRSYLRHAQKTGMSLRSLAKATRLGQGRLRRELEAAVITVWSAKPPGTQLRDGRQGCAPAPIAR
jgi:ROS/MUCR transcriptional regulator protein